jgi:hypothetical protein
MKKLALALVTGLLAGVTGYVGKTVIGPVVVAEWGPGLRRSTTDDLLFVDGLTWGTWRLILAGAAGLYILLAGGLLVWRVRSRGPEHLSGGLVVANIPGVLVIGDVLFVVALLVLAVAAVCFGVYGAFRLLEAVARGAVSSVRDVPFELVIWHRRRRERRRYQQVLAARGPRPSLLRSGEFSTLDDDFPVGLPGNTT